MTFEWQRMKELELKETMLLVEHLQVVRIQSMCNGQREQYVINLSVISLYGMC